MKLFIIDVVLIFSWVSIGLTAEHIFLKLTFVILKTA